jgi:hypothetical protein
MWSLRRAITIFIAVTGCAHYSTSSGLVGGIRSVAIPEAENRTAEELVSEALTERTSTAFTTDGRLRVVDRESADGMLVLRLTALEDRPFTFTAEEETEQYRFRVWVDAVLLKTEDDSELLKLKDLEGWGTYDAATADEDGRDVAIGAALDMVIEEIVDRTTASW